VTTTELRKAVKGVDARARVSKIDDGHWTIRAWDSAAVEKLLPSLGLSLDPRRTDIEGSRWHWITVLHVFDNPIGHAAKKSPGQLDAEIAEVLTKPTRPAAPTVVYLQTREGHNHELSGRRLAKLRKDAEADRAGPALTNLVASGYVGFVGPDGELWDLEALPGYLVGGAP